MKKFFGFIIVFFLIIFGSLFFYQNQYSKKNIIQKKQIVVSQSISLNNKKNFINYHIKEGKTALDLLKQTSKVKTKGEGKNAYIISINNQKASTENREYWAFYVNDKMASVGAGSYQLKNNDKIEWKIEKY